MTKRSASSSAFRFVLTIGFANLFADMAYEGGAAINGPFLASLGASAAAIGIVAAAGEFLGYTLRSVSGRLADKTGKYWLITVAGYAVNLLSVPAMALAPSWPAASVLVLTERIGRAFRKPTVEAMLSYTTAKFGKGKVYAINNALDETGAAMGPLVVAGVLAWRASVRTGYAILLVPALAAIATILAARFRCPIPARLDEEKASAYGSRDFSRAYWLYMAGGSLFAAGITSFELVSFHLVKSGLVAAERVPLFLTLGTVAGIGASLLLGRAYDRAGIGVLIGAVVVAAAYPALVFLGGLALAIAGLVLWGVAYAIQDTLMKVLIASVLPEGRRNFAFGVFYLGYGGGWLLGGIATGLLYDRSKPALVAFATGAFLVSIPFFARGAKRSIS